MPGIQNKIEKLTAQDGEQTRSSGDSINVSIALSESESKTNQPLIARFITQYFIENPDAIKITHGDYLFENNIIHIKDSIFRFDTSLDTSINTDDHKQSSTYKYAVIKRNLDKNRNNLPQGNSGVIRQALTTFSIGSNNDPDAIVNDDIPMVIKQIQHDLKKKHPTEFARKTMNEVYSTRTKKEATMAQAFYSSLFQSNHPYALSSSRRDTNPNPVSRRIDYHKGNILMPNGGDTNVKELIDTNKLTLNQKIDIFWHMLNQTQHYIVQGYLHRDIKPEQFVYNSNTECLLLVDFETATLKSTPSNQVVGSPRYIAPEFNTPQQDNLAPYSEKSEAYSLGVSGTELFNTPSQANKAKPEEAEAEREIKSILAAMRTADPSKRLSVQQAIEKFKPIYDKTNRLDSSGRSSSLGMEKAG